MEVGLGTKSYLQLWSDWQLLAAGRQRVSFSDEIIGPGQMIMLYSKSTHYRIFEHYKLVLMGKKEEKDTKLDGWGRQG